MRVGEKGNDTFDIGGVNCAGNRATMKLISNPKSRAQFRRREEGRNDFREMGGGGGDGDGKWEWKIGGSRNAVYSLLSGQIVNYYNVSNVFVRTRALFSFVLRLRDTSERLVRRVDSFPSFFLLFSFFSDE